MKKRMMTACIIGSILLLSGCNEKVQQDVPALLEPAASLNEVAVVKRGDISNRAIYEAQAIPYTEEISFNSEGIVDKMKVKLGDTVHKGQLLGQLQGAEENARVIDVENDIENNKSEYEEANVNAEYDILIMEAEKEQLEKQLKKVSKDEKKKLKKDIAVKKMDIEIARQKLKNDKEIQKIELGELERKKADYEKESSGLFLYATMDGIVTFAVKEGDMVSASSLAVAISDNSKIYVKSDFVSSKDYERAERCYVKYLDTETEVAERPYNASEVKELFKNGQPVFSYFDIKSDNYAFKIGDYLDLYLESAGKNDVLILPVNAVYFDDERSYVYKKDGDGKVITDVQTGIKSTSFVEITGGLEEGDEVYVKP